MRRYIIRGLIDGSLSTLGIVIGAQSASIGVIVAAGLGGGLANGLSNILGALTAEKTETELKITEIQKAMVIGPELRNTYFYKRMQILTILSGICDGIATIIGSIIPLIPFLFSLIIKFDKNIALMTSIILTITLLFLIGCYLGIISRANLIISGIKMVIAGLVTAFLCTIIEHILLS
ncbi:MAG TPA: TIGR00267 family protein [Archaeoglobus profundus]|nr:TIGR00267 family protein [Archaeoglobus profundus]